jgi:hypothetical protein
VWTIELAKTPLVAGVPGVAALANHVGRLKEEGWRYRQAERLGGLEVDDQLERGGLLHREVGGRWGTPYQGMYESDFWKRPAFQHWRVMLERGRQFASPGTMNAAAGEVLATYVIGHMVQRVLVEKVAVEKAVEDAHKRVVEIYARHQAG